MDAATRARGALPLAPAAPRDPRAHSRAWYGIIPSIVLHRGGSIDALVQWTFAAPRRAGALVLMLAPVRGAADAAARDESRRTWAGHVTLSARWLDPVRWS